MKETSGDPRLHRSARLRCLCRTPTGCSDSTFSKPPDRARRRAQRGRQDHTARRASTRAFRGTRPHVQPRFHALPGVPESLDSSELRLRRSIALPVVSAFRGRFGNPLRDPSRLAPNEARGKGIVLCHTQRSSRPPLVGKLGGPGSDLHARGNRAPLSLRRRADRGPYADPEKTSELIESAILNLLGLNIVDQLDRDLKVFERRKRAEDKDGPESTRIRHGEEEAARARTRLSNLRRDGAELNTRISHKQQEAERLEHEFRAAGGPLYEIRSELESLRQEGQAELSELEATLREHAAGALPLLLVKGLLGSAVSAATNERTSKREALVLDALTERDTGTLAFLREHDASREMLSLVESFLADDRAARKGLAEPDAHLGLPDDVPAKLEALLENTLPEASATASATLHRHSLNRDGGASVEEKLAHVPDEDLIAPFIDQRERLEAELAALERLNERNSIEVESAVSELERLEKTLTDLQEGRTPGRGSVDTRSPVLSATR